MLHLRPPSVPEFIADKDFDLDGRRIETGKGWFKSLIKQPYRARPADKLARWIHVTDPDTTDTTRCGKRIPYTARIHAGSETIKWLERHGFQRCPTCFP